MSDVKVEVDHGELVVRIPIVKPLRPSKSGKTLVVASTRGNFKSGVEYEGKEIIVGLNAYVYPE